MFEHLPPRDHWVVIRRPERPDPGRLDIVGVFPDPGAAAAAAARLDALAGGPRHWVQVLVHLRVSEARELP